MLVPAADRRRCAGRRASPASRRARGAAAGPRAPRRPAAGRRAASRCTEGNRRHLDDDLAVAVEVDGDDLPARPSRRTTAGRSCQRGCSPNTTPVRRIWGLPPAIASIILPGALVQQTAPSSHQNTGVRESGTRLTPHAARPSPCRRGGALRAADGDGWGRGHADQGRGAGAWALGDYHRFAKATVWEIGPVLVEACAISPGQRVLDVAAGTGNTAIVVSNRPAMRPPLVDCAWGLRRHRIISRRFCADDGLTQVLGHASRNACSFRAAGLKVGRARRRERYRRRRRRLRWRGPWSPGPCQAASNAVGRVVWRW